MSINFAVFTLHVCTECSERIQRNTLTTDPSLTWTGLSTFIPLLAPWGYHPPQGSKQTQSWFLRPLLILLSLFWVPPLDVEVDQSASKAAAFSLSFQSWCDGGWWRETRMCEAAIIVSIMHQSQTRSELCGKDMYPLWKVSLWCQTEIIIWSQAFLGRDPLCDVHVQCIRWVCS